MEKNTLLLNIEKFKTQLEYLPTRIKQEMMYKAKMKMTHFLTSIEGNYPKNMQS